MRTAFADTILSLAREDPRIYLLVGDLGFGVFNAFRAEFPQRFVNVGVAESNLAGIGAGLALAGMLPFLYSIGNFPTLRCLEQVRNDICYHAARAVIVSVGGGLSYGALGATHHATEDIAVMRSLPGMAVVAPADPIEAALATRAAYAHGGPVYLRLNRAGDPLIHDQPPAFQIGRAIQLRAGGEVTLIASGGIVHNTLLAADHLAERGIVARVLSMHTVKPIDSEAILSAARDTGVIVTVEEHSAIGGLGSAVAEVLAESAMAGARFLRVALPDVFSHLVGSQEYLRERHGLHPRGIAARVETLLRGECVALSSGDRHA